jgi:Domain of unknown function (DUF4157)/Effector protein
MGNQRLIQTQTAATDRKQHLDKRTKQPELSMQEVLGSRAASRYFRAQLQRPQAEGTSGLNPLHSILQMISPVSPRVIQAKPMFRGLSHELTSALDSDGMAATQDLESCINRARSGGQPLEAGLQRKLGQAMGADFSEVRVHADAQADQLNRSIQAKAFTTGQNVFFRQGAYNPGSRGGQALIAHELTHVVQQKEGRVKPTVQINGAEVNDDPTLEAEADEARFRIDGGKPVPIVSPLASGIQPKGNGLIQMLSEKTLIKDAKREAKTKGEDFSAKKSSLAPLIAALKRYRKNPGEDELVAVEMERTFLSNIKSGKYSATLNKIDVEIEQEKKKYRNNQDKADFQYSESSDDDREPIKVLRESQDDIDFLNSENDNAGVDWIPIENWEKQSELLSLLNQSLQVVDKKTNATAQNQITRKEMQKIYKILEDVYLQQGKANLGIEMTAAIVKHSFVANAEELGKSMPEALRKIEYDYMRYEGKIKQSAANLDNFKDRLWELKTNKNRSLEEEQEYQELQEIENEEKAKIRQASNQIPEDEYNTSLQQLVIRETMKDLVKIAQTGVGRELLQELAKERFEEHARKVKIRPTAKPIIPDAGGDSAGNSPTYYANYTPQYFKERDQALSADDTIEKRAVKFNPWQLNDRTDVTLFHELVHTLHYQQGIMDPTDPNAKLNLVAKNQATHKVDKPYEAITKFGESERMGVPVEEYRTVGLREFAKDPITENAYRQARQDLGEDIALRTTYTHKGKKGVRLQQIEQANETEKKRKARRVQSRLSLSRALIG